MFFVGATTGRGRPQRQSIKDEILPVDGATLVVADPNNQPGMCKWKMGLRNEKQAKGPPGFVHYQLIKC
jgi:hypothetical protein